jgi:ABC-type transport system involved in cytochrome bd biosynthesis fused ATPase/permease subunit
MKLCLGSVGIKGSVAYMGQRPFIQNSTLRDNITFGMSPALYCMMRGRVYTEDKLLLEI